jgi:hypothetical protein
MRMTKRKSDVEEDDIQDATDINMNEIDDVVDVEEIVK